MSAALHVALTLAAALLRIADHAERRPLQRRGKPLPAGRRAYPLE